jgi:hypothetical protein
VDELALLILADLVVTREWNEWNYLNEANRGAYRGEPAHAIAGALGWLRGQGLIARDPANPSDSAIVVTPAGRRVVASSLSNSHETAEGTRA